MSGQKLSAIRNAIDVPVWTATAKPGPSLPRLSDSVEADVAIVGAGYTGLSAAIELARNGASVVVVDAAPLGAGASGRNGGQINPGLKLDPFDAEKALGPQAESVLAFAGAAPSKVFDIVSRYEIDCNPTRCGWLMPAHRQSAMPILHKRAEGWRKHGVDAKLLSGAETQRLIGSEAFVGGLLDPRGGNLQPLSYVRGLADAALREGARIYIGSPVLSLNPQGSRTMVKTAAGSILASNVILATNGYTDGLWPGLRKTIVPVHSFQIATVPVQGPIADRIFPEGHHAADTRHLIQYFRKDPAGRILVGGQGKPGGARSAADFSHLLQSLIAMFPALSGVEIDYAWSGVVAVTPDYLPHVHELRPGVTAALGYNGRGVAMATAVGQSLAQHLLNPAQPIAIPVTRPRKIPFHGLNQVYAEIAARYFRHLDRS